MERAVTVLLILLVAGCATTTPPSRFHVLAPLAPETQSTAGPARLVVMVGPVRLPAYLDRSELVRRRGASGLVVEEFERWGGELRTDLERVLAQDLAARLPGSAVITPPWDAAVHPDRQLQLTVLRFEGDDHNRVVLAVQWRWVDPEAARLLALGRERLEVPMAEDSADAMVTAMNRALAMLAERLAFRLSGASAGGPEPRHGSFDGR